jgi:ATP-dependent Clp protease adapter protein ClpS
MIWGTIKVWSGFSKDVVVTGITDSVCFLFFILLVLTNFFSVTEIHATRVFFFF